MKQYAFQHVKGRGFRKLVPISVSAAVAPELTMRAQRPAPPIWPADLIGDSAVAVCEACQNLQTNNTGKPSCIKMGGCKDAVRFVAAVRVRGCVLGFHDSIERNSQ